MPAKTSDYALGRRIVIWGATGAGKTTLARRLGQRLHLHVVDLDEIRHANGWDSVGYDEFRARLTAVLDEHPDGWVTAGSYSAIMDVYLSRADTLVWLNLPWRVSFWRLLKRTVRRAHDQGELYPGSPARESWRLSFFDRRSILWWSIRQHGNTTRKFQQRIEGLRSDVRVQEMRSARDVAALVASIEGRSIIDRFVLHPLPTEGED